MSNIRRIAIIGAGLMGHTLAADIARHGFEVSLTDANEQLLRSSAERMRDVLRVLANAGLMKTEAVEEAIGRVAMFDSIDGAAANADFVLEAVSERLESKREVFTRLDSVCRPSVILASNTSGLAASALSAGLAHPERVLVAHHFNPPHLVPAVEVVPSPSTSPAIVQETMLFLKEAGKTPILVKREVPGFIANRLQAALLREAFALVESGVIEPQDLDTLVKKSLGRRLDVLGPFEVLDFAGVDVWNDILSYLSSDLANHTVPPRLLQELVSAGRLGVKQGRGVYPWPREAMEAARERRDRELLRQMIQDDHDGLTSATIDGR